MENNITPIEKPEIQKPDIQEPKETEPKAIEPQSQEPKAAGYRPTKRESLNLKMFTVGLLGVLAAAILIVGGLGIYRVYAKIYTDKFTYTVANILRLPAAKINGVVIRYTQYVDDLAAIHILRDYDKANNGPSASLTGEQMSDQVLWRLLNNILIEDVAKNLGVTVEKEDVDEIKNQIMRQFKTPEEASAALQERYGWTMPQYEAKVIRYFILQNKLSDKIQGDAKLRQEIYSKAEALLQEIKDGADFVEKAKEHSEDGTAENGGDLGWFAKGDMVPQFEEAVFALKKGDLASEVIETPFGFHLIRAEDSKTEDGVEKMRARHIFFRFPSVDTYLESATKNAKIHLYIKVHNPFEDKNNTVAAG